MDKTLIYDFYQEFFNNHDIESAKKYVREDYIQHNPGLPSGRTALMETFREKFEKEKDFYLEIEHILIDGNMIAVHAKNIARDGTVKCKVVDFYREENGKLVEHWDVIQKL